MSRVVRLFVLSLFTAAVLALAPGQAFADDHDPGDRALLADDAYQQPGWAAPPARDYAYRTRFGQRTHRTAVSPYRHIRDNRGYFHIAPLLGAPGLFGDVTARQQTTDLEVGPFESLADINLTAGVGFEVGYRNVGLKGDFRHFDGTIDQNGENFALEKFITNAVVDWNWQVVPMLQLGPVAGIRHVAARAGEVVDENEHLDTGNWLDPIVGVDGRLTFADLVYVPFYADIGGIGYGSEITWQGYGGVGVSLNSTDIELGYRALYADFEGTRLDYDLLQAGPSLMTRFRF